MRQLILVLLGVHTIMAQHQETIIDKYEDHRVTLEQATVAARILGTEAKQKGSDIEGSSAGCGRCTFQERLYCESAALFNDHCCCDTKLREPLTFAPHECWVQLPPARPCMPVAENCAEYSRIMECCCKHILFRQSPHGGHNVPSWVPYLMGEALMSWISHTAGQNKPQQYSQNDSEGSGHNKLDSGAQRKAGGLTWYGSLLLLLLLAS